MIKWTAIDPDNLPEGEVLAVNFKPYSYGYKEKIVGYVYHDEDDNIVKASSEETLLENVTHFVMVHDFDVEPKKEKK